MEPAVRETEVQEPGPGDLDGVDMRGRVRRQVVGQLGAELARVQTRAFRRGKRNIRGPVTVLAVGGALEVDRVGLRVDLTRGQRVAERGFENVGDHRVR